MWCILLVLGYVLLAIYEFVPLYKQKMWREFGINAGLGLLSFTSLFLIWLRIRIPSPAGPIKDFITSIFGK